MGRGHYKVLAKLPRKNRTGKAVQAREREAETGMDGDEPRLSEIARTKQRQAHEKKTYNPGGRQSDEGSQKEKRAFRRARQGHGGEGERGRRQITQS